MGLLNAIRGSICKGTIGKIFNTLSFTKYMNYCVSYYKSVGVQINQPVTYIHPSVYFDSHNYSLITVGKNVTISRNVTLLVHDHCFCTCTMHIATHSIKNFDFIHINQYPSLLILFSFQPTQLY